MAKNNGRVFSAQEFWMGEAKVASKIEYIVDKNNGVVVAQMRDCGYDAIKIARKIGAFPILEMDNMNSGEFNKFMMGATYRGIAKCSPEDEWDEFLGKKIARNRMLEKYYLARFKALKNIFDYNEGVIDRLAKHMYYCEKKLNECEMELL